MGTTQQVQGTEITTGWDKQLLSSEYSKQWQLEISKEPNAEIIKDVLKKYKAIAVSNGSFKQGWGVAAWTIEGGDKDGRLVGIGFTPGTNSNQSAFQSELGGIYGVVLTLKYLMARWEPKPMSIIIACNDKSAVDQLNSTKPIQASEAHYDLLSAIQTMRKYLPMTSRLIHVKGHQDMGTTSVLPRTAWMNIEMDMAAKQKADNTQTNSGPWQIPVEPWSCQISGQKLVKNIEKQLWEHIIMEPIMAYWKSKGRAAGPGMNIDWDSMGWAMKESSVAEKICL